jgi:hypothetical protein
MVQTTRPSISNPKQTEPEMEIIVEATSGSAVVVADDIAKLLR